METISYSNKIAPRYYICADCLRKVDGTSVHALGAFFQVACSLCGKVGLNTRIPEASFNKARKANGGKRD